MTDTADKAQSTVGIEDSAATPHGKRLPVVGILDKSDLFEWVPVRERETRIGRGDEMDLTLDDATVSRCHARIEYINPGAGSATPSLVLHDEGSRNGTYLNGKRVTKPMALTTGDRIFIGKACMLFYLRTEQEIMADEQMRKLATRDALTGLYNRGFMIRQFEQEFHRALRYRRPLTALMLDLDDFKKINDHYGHRVGDEALRLVAQQLLSRIRVHDLAGRYGGEEFSVLLPETTLAGARVFAERIRSAIAEATFTALQRDLHITASIGLAELNPATDDSLELLLGRADEALYAAKRAGKNRVHANGLDEESETLGAE